jgi:hypothetical protein
VSRRTIACSALLLAGGLLAGAAPAGAQQADPIPPFVVDVRGSFVRYGRDAELAAAYGLEAESLPSRGFGIDVGAHVYFLRWKQLTFGAGAGLLFSRGTETTAVVEEGPLQPAVRTRFRAFAPQVSFNFGHRDGWSYISGGIGPARLTISPADRDDPPAGPSLKTINYGGGARWFVRRHIAFAVDVRFYAIAPREEEDDVPGNPRMTWLAVNVGISLR